MNRGVINENIHLLRHVLERPYFFSNVRRGKPKEKIIIKYATITGGWRSPAQYSAHVPQGTSSEERGYTA